MGDTVAKEGDAGRLRAAVSRRVIGRFGSMTRILWFASASSGDVRSTDHPSEERLDEASHGVGVVGEGPVAALVKDRDLSAREGLPLTVGHRYWDVWVVCSPNHER